MFSLVLFYGYISAPIAEPDDFTSSDDGDNGDDGDDDDDDDGCLFLLVVGLVEAVLELSPDNCISMVPSFIDSSSIE